MAMVLALALAARLLVLVLVLVPPAQVRALLPLALGPFRVPALLFYLRMLQVVLVLVHLLQVLIQCVLYTRRCVR